MRSNIARILLLSTAVVMAFAPATWAVDDATAPGDPWSRHPLVGTWSVDTIANDAHDPTDTAIFRPDGTMTESGPAGRGAGIWIPLGDRRVSAVFNVPSSTEASFNGFVTVRTTIVVSQDGESFAGTYTLEGPAAAGLSAAATVPEPLLGTRLSVSLEPEPLDDGH